MYLENKTEIFYSKNIEIQFRKMYTHFKKGMVKNMKNWKKIMAGLCAATMVSSMVVPVWAAEETTEEAADDGDVADVSEAMLGLWKDSAGDIYGFYKDNSFFGQWKDEEQDVLGVYALSSDGEYTALVMQFANDDGTYDDENMVTYLVQANEEENLLELYDEENLELTATLEPYQADGDEADYNQTYQDMGDILTECYSGETEAGETFIYAANDDGTFCSVLVIDQDDNYVSFVGEGTFDEENGTVTITDEVSEMALTFGVTLNDDDTLTLDMGDLGSATVQEATLAVAVQGLKYAVENGTEMN